MASVPCRMGHEAFKVHPRAEIAERHGGRSLHPMVSPARPIPVWALTDRDCSTDVSARNTSPQREQGIHSAQSMALACAAGWCDDSRHNQPLLPMVARSKPGFPAEGHHRMATRQGKPGFHVPSRPRDVGYGRRAMPAGLCAFQSSRGWRGGPDAALGVWVYKRSVLGSRDRISLS